MPPRAQPISDSDGAGRGGTSEDDRLGFEAALAHAEQGYKEGGVPIGAALVYHGVDTDPASTAASGGIGERDRRHALVGGGRILGQGHNQRVQRGSAILHAEIAALDDAGRQMPGVYRNATMYTTLSPCSMCTGAILLYKIPRVVIGENINFRGDEDLLKSRGVEVVILDDDRCKSLMARYIQENPED
ncbi:cytidine deaminase-like protein [Trametes polyzona]|nr:cytidine deaminase-like protein [Trametes polyzona]